MIARKGITLVLQLKEKQIPNNSAGKYENESGCVVIISHFGDQIEL